MCSLHPDPASCASCVLRPSMKGSRLPSALFSPRCKPCWRQKPRTHQCRQNASRRVPRLRLVRSDADWGRGHRAEESCCRCNRVCCPPAISGPACEQPTQRTAQCKRVSATWLHRVTSTRTSARPHLRALGVHAVQHGSVRALHKQPGRGNAMQKYAREGQRALQISMCSAVAHE